MTPDSTDHGHCFRCRTRKEIAGATQVRLRNGKMALSGACVTCGTRIFRLVRAEDAPEDTSAVQDSHA